MKSTKSSVIPIFLKSALSWNVLLRQIYVGKKPPTPTPTPTHTPTFLLLSCVIRFHFHWKQKHLECEFYQNKFKEGLSLNSFSIHCLLSIIVIIDCMFDCFLPFFDNLKNISKQVSCCWSLLYVLICAYCGFTFQDWRFTISTVQLIV